MTEGNTAIPESELQLNESRLTASSFEFLSPLKAGPIELRISELKTHSKIYRTSREIKVFLEYKTIAHEQGRDLFKLSASYYASFKASETTSDDQLRIFAKLNALAIVFPTMRACIATLTLAASLPPLTLPIINFQKINTPLEELD